MAAVISDSALPAGWMDVSDVLTFPLRHRLFADVCKRAAAAAEMIQLLILFKRFLVLLLLFSEGWFPLIDRNKGDAGELGEFVNLRF